MSLASVVICAHNHLQDLTIPCLDHVLEGTRYRYELILIDDGSRDGTIQYFATVTDKAYGFAKRGGVARARNLGLEAAKGDPIVFINNDLFVPDGWLGILAEESEKPGVGIVAGIPSNEIDRLKAPSGEDGLIDFDHVSGALMGVTRDCFDTVGYFDGSLLNNGEDTDYCYRARLAGFRVVSTPRLIAEHLNGGTRRDLDRKEIARSAMRFRRKYTGQNVALPPVYPFG